MDPRRGREEAEEARQRKRAGFSKLVTTSGGRPGGRKTSYISRFVLPHI
jgi:hypothetical protein